MDENNIINNSFDTNSTQEILEEKYASIKDSFQRGIIPEELKNFVESLNEDDDSIEEELLSDDPEEENVNSLENYSVDDSQIERSHINLDTDVSVDDLNDFF